MQKLNFFSCALLFIPLTVLTTANAKVDTGDLYPTPIDWQINDNVSAEVPDFHLPGELNTIMKYLLAGERRSSTNLKNHESMVEIQGVTQFLKKMLIKNKIPSGIHTADVVLLSHYTTAPMVAEKRIFAKQKTEPVMDEKISGRYIKKVKTAVHSGHFYKPFLERPEMFY